MSGNPNPQVQPMSGNPNPQVQPMSGNPNPQVQPMSGNPNDPLRLNELPILIQIAGINGESWRSTQISRQTFADLRNNPDWVAVIIIQHRKRLVSKKRGDGPCKCRPADNKRKRDDQDPDDSDKRRSTEPPQSRALTMAPTN
jgi:hypothetical protein